MEDKNNAYLVGCTAQIVAAYIARNDVDDLEDFMRRVHGALKRLVADEARISSNAAPIPAVPVSKSIMPDYLVCLEDGKKMKMLKRHLMTSYNLTPEQYREKWNLPRDYPMTAPNYAVKRSELAKESGLGKGRR